MRAVIQRVLHASVTISGQVVSEIGPGLLVFVGIEEPDTMEDASFLAGKISRMRLFDDADHKPNLSILDVQGEFLVVSQFTLFASTKKGNRPSYIRAARPETAIPLYEEFVRVLKVESGRPVRTGTFGADMKVALVNDGPITILIDTKDRE
ncbi:MAG TPA: D-aminoacyl-tRNA deacylase [Leptospiraceae bacterium]|jgi:D-tyrosyl-tRNA(Tyr) deacylase|nr:D-tyrosyl-tRNA(Tyr) deacylase [Leptospirales bacterium]HMU84171.1 D-aminoacyl-tRNA deacylase [Leptospiraceae bacterium]HMY45838.1 D-aminoacyl-tRNA deacylase [Leptospiraceae bacterium]HMZ36016.1 D-aminoacyl-tRNA deacylase [Leptospiraceae bacterium]HNJ03631.1 D-aminoacyl-tRNA deacylase [Leptospiraceae bacterium]